VFPSSPHALRMRSPALHAAIRLISGGLLFGGLAAGCETISDDQYDARLAWGSSDAPSDDSADPGTTDGCPDGESTWYADLDGDGYGDPTTAEQACEQPSNTVANYDDCDDSDPDVAIPAQWFLDSDGDGVGGDTVTTSCHAPIGYVPLTGDCNDTSADAYPGATEICDSLDNDCNGATDDDDPNLDLTDVPVGYRDADSDGVGTDTETIQACVVPSGYVLGAGDCDDSEPLASPELTEVCDDGIDNDCDGTANSCELPSSIALDTQADVRLYSDQPFVSHGERVVPIGDVSADGLGDLAVSVPGEGEGTVYVLSELPSLAGDTETETAARARLAGPADDGRFGYQVAALGDVNGDLLADLAIADPYDDTVDTDAGAVWLIAGPISGEVDVAAIGHPLYGEALDAKAGWAVHSAGDPNNDGVTDLIVGAYADPTAGSQAGAAYVVHGPVTGAVDLGDADWVVRGGFQDRVGFSVVGDADLDGDGISDLIVGADRVDPGGVTNAGAAMVFYGPVSGSAVGDDADAYLFSTTTSAYVGVALAAGGDLDGDGQDDLLVGATGENGGGTSGTGSVFIFSGPVSGVRDVAGSTGRIDGLAAGDTVGGAVSSVPDMNWDGRQEVFVGARGVDQGSGGRDGGAYLWFGPVTGTTDLSTADIALLGADGAQAGAAVAGAADLNADGLGDLIVGAPTGNTAFVVFGGGL